MKYLLTSEEMKRVDETTSEYFLIPSLVLMERAALSVADEICNQFDHNAKILIACGNGNNGGDGYALGRILSERGFDVHFFMVKKSDYCSESNLRQKEILSKMEIDIYTELTNCEYDIIVDAIIGIGLKAELKQDYKQVIQLLNRKRGVKIALDIPTGINADTGEVYDCFFAADITFTFAYMKKGLMLYPAKEFCGNIICKDIGIHDIAFRDAIPECKMLEFADLKSLLPKRVKDSHKGTYKKVGVIAGSSQVAGAMMLASHASLRTGVGYTKVLSAKENRELLLANCPECLFYDDDCYDVSILGDCSAIAIGPGIGTSEKATHLVDSVLKEFDGDLVIDADAINIIASNPDFKELLKQYAMKHIVILTPHKKELERFYGKQLPSDKSELFFTEKKIAIEFHIYLVCKDAATRIYGPNGELYINNSGNDGMATAGSGDVLTGILAGLLAQNCDKTTVAPLGVYLHGLCGDYAKETSNVYSLNASDLIDSMKYILK